MEEKKPSPWWCTCDSGTGSTGHHEAWCYGEQEFMPRAMAALRARGDGGPLKRYAQGTTA